MNSPLQARSDLFSPFDALQVSDSVKQIGSRVRWWDARGQLMHGQVKAFNVLNDVRFFGRTYWWPMFKRFCNQNSQVVVIQVEDGGQPPTVVLPYVIQLSYLLISS
jgi:hypothetical protein